MSHEQIIDIGYKWLKKRCSFALKEFKTVNKEVPDIIGFIGDYSFLLEAKTSRSDFLADKKKPFRINPNLGMGDFRFFIAPIGLISKSELPTGWGLLEISSNDVTETYSPFGIGNIYSNWNSNTKNVKAEMNLMYSALRRINYTHPNILN